jgi:hypothetical protein
MDVKAIKESAKIFIDAGGRWAVQKANLLLSFLGFAETLPEGEQMYYTNQDIMGKDITQGILTPGIFFQIVVALTQSGKTGCMNALIQQCTVSVNNKIPPENMFVITGLSSKDWVEQTKGRMPEMIVDQIYHQNTLKKLAEKLKGKENVLIIVDEVHIAVGIKMSINKMMKELGYKDETFLIEKNINFVEFSATPGAVLEDHVKWKEEGKALIHTMEPGTGYKGPADLLNGRAFQWEKLDSDDKYREKSMSAINKIKEKIEEIYSSPKFHFIRAPKGEKFDVVKDRFKQVFGTSDYEFVNCHSESESSIDDILRNGFPQFIRQEDGTDIPTKPKDFPAPKKHTFIFIKENMRCAYTIGPKQNVGILYERYTDKPQEHVIVQGMAGRACGYNVPDDMIVFTDLHSLKAYKQDWDNHFSDIKHYKKQKTAFTPSGFKGNQSDDTPTTKPKDDFDYKVFDDEKIALSWIKNKIPDWKARACSSQAPKEMRQSGDRNPTIEAIVDRKWGLSDKAPRRQIRLDNNKICVYWRPSILNVVKD